MKKYIIRPFKKPHGIGGFDADGQPIARGVNAARRAGRSLDELIGICKGCIADGLVNAMEGDFLAAWLTDNWEIANTWPANILSARIEAMLLDDVIDEAEREDLFSLLKELVGEPGKPKEAASAASTLPVDPVLKPIVFDNKLFCLTGKFVYGPRDRCEGEIRERGGRVAGRVNRELDYLVIGTLGSADWIHSTYGRKIETAVDFRSKGLPVSIVAEEHWAAQLM